MEICSSAIIRIVPSGNNVRFIQETAPGHFKTSENREETLCVQQGGVLSELLL